MTKCKRQLNDFLVTNKSDANRILANMRDSAKRGDLNLKHYLIKCPGKYIIRARSKRR